MLSILGNANGCFGGAVAQRQITKKFSAGTEVFRRASMERVGRDDTLFNAGATIDIAEEHHLLLSAGHSIDGPTEFQLYIAYQLTFGPAAFDFINR